MHEENLFFCPKTNENVYITEFRFLYRNKLKTYIYIYTYIVNLLFRCLKQTGRYIRRFSDFLFQINPNLYPTDFHLLLRKQHAETFEIKLLHHTI